uniref:Uncharacterized protein n=1 Tax=Glossina austeni TaxID=7395 RepID=A0A1A9UJU6_GLOAU
MDVLMVKTQELADSSITFKNQSPQFYHLAALQPFQQNQPKHQKPHSRKQKDQHNNQNSRQSQSQTNQLPKLKQKAINNDLESLNGHLYDLFKKRLDAVQKELTFHKINNEKKKTRRKYPFSYQNNLSICEKLQGQQQTQTRTTRTRNEDRSAVTYDDEVGNGREGKRSSMKDSFSEEYKKRVDKVENGLRKEENTLTADRLGRSFLDWVKSNAAAKRAHLTTETKRQKAFIGENAPNPARFDKTLYDFTNSNTIKESLFEEYRKQIDIINNALQALDKRANRKADSYAWENPLPLQRWLTTKNDQHTQPDNNLIWTREPSAGAIAKRDVQFEAQTDLEENEEMGERDNEYDYPNSYRNTDTLEQFHPSQMAKDYRNHTNMKHNSVVLAKDVEDLEDLGDVIDDRATETFFHEGEDDDDTEDIKSYRTVDDFNEKRLINMENGLNMRVKDDVDQVESEDETDYRLDPQETQESGGRDDMDSETYHALHNFEETNPVDVNTWLETKNDPHSRMRSHSAWRENRHFGPARRRLSKNVRKSKGTVDDGAITRIDSAWRENRHFGPARRRLSKNVRKSKDTVDDDAITRIDRTPEICEQVRPQDLRSWSKTNSIECTQLDDDNSNWIKNEETGTNLRRIYKSLAPTTVSKIVGGHTNLPNSGGMLGATNNSLYPTVLTKALEISLNPSNNANSGNLLANVAKRLNTTTLDLAEKIVNSGDVNQYALSNGGHLNKMVENYMSKTVISPKPFSAPVSITTSAAAQRLRTTNNPAYRVATTKTTAPAMAVKQQVVHNVIATTAASLIQRTESNIQDNYAAAAFSYTPENNGYSSESGSQSAANLSAILDRVLMKLEKIQAGKSNSEDETEHPDGTPCDLVGSWSSQILGFCFDMHLSGQKNRDLENKNKNLIIDIQECVPPKVHNVMDLDWKFGGNTLKQIGGPFYMYAEKKIENLAATFLGFCRTCGGIDTIYGSWTFLLPSKDCSDTSLAFDVKRDIIRRSRMESKRKERYKNLFYRGQSTSKRN